MKININGVKNKAYLIILSSFIIGIITGGLLMNLLAARSAASKASKSPMDEISVSLDLDQGQRKQIEKIFQDSKQHSKEIIKTVQPQLDELWLQTRSKVQAVLRPDQLPKYEIWNKKRELQKAQKEQQK